MRLCWRAMEKAELIKKMEARVGMCRRLAQSTTDKRAAEVLMQIVQEGEADIARLLAEEDP